jgi:hypothetical protein
MPSVLERSAVLTLAALTCALLACSDATPRGKNVLRWNRTMSGRPEVSKGRVLDDTVGQTLKLTVKPSGQGPLELMAQIEVGTIEINEDGEKRKRKSPILIDVSIEKNEDWKVSGKCDASGPFYDKPVLVDGQSVQTPDVLTQTCSIDLKGAGDAVHVVSLEVTGDGSAGPTMPGGTVTVEQVRAAE